MKRNVTAKMSLIILAVATRFRGKDGLRQDVAKT